MSIFQKQTASIFQKPYIDSIPDWWYKVTQPSATCVLDKSRFSLSSNWNIVLDGPLYWFRTNMLKSQLFHTKPSRDKTEMLLWKHSQVPNIVFHPRRRPNSRKRLLKDYQLKLHALSSVISLNAGQFCLFLSSADIIQINFKKSGIPLECQQIWIEISPTFWRSYNGLKLFARVTSNF